MALRTPPRWAPPLAAALLAVAGCAWIVQAALAERRAAFDTDARIAHRLLSTQAAQHDAMLATLTLLQPADPAPPGAAAAEQRLPAWFPQVLAVARRARGQDWPAAAGDATRLAAAQAESARLQRAVLAELDLARGQYTLVRAGEPASFALRIDASRALAGAEWPLPAGGPVRAALQLDGQRWTIQPGDAGRGVTQLQADKVLASDSQPFLLHIARPVAWTELPWLRLLLWCAAVAAGTLALAAWQRQRQATRRAQELLRLGQVGRLNALGELAAGMAHELNQPLTAVLAGTQAAQRLLDDVIAARRQPAGTTTEMSAEKSAERSADADADLAVARQALQTSAQQARRAGEVVARLRRLVQTPDADAAPQDLPLAELLHHVLDLLQPQAQGVQVDLQGVPAALRVRADPVALEQVLHNLVLNALQALQRVPAGARRLAFVAGLDAGRVQLRVQDSGPGFAPDALTRAFEPFYTTRDGGLGLGLSLCETLAAGMGGALGARNRPGGGAELVLTLLPAAA